MAVGLRAIRALDFVLDTPAATAIIEDVGDSNIVLRFFGWVDQSQTDFLKGRSLALDAAKRALEGAGFALPGPIYRLRFDENIPLQSKGDRRSEEHTSELQSLMRLSYAVFCLTKKKTVITINTH